MWELTAKADAWLEDQLGLGQDVPHDIMNVGGSILSTGGAILSTGAATVISWFS